MKGGLSQSIFTMWKKTFENSGAQNQSETLQLYIDSLLLQIYSHNKIEATLSNHVIRVQIMFMPNTV